MYRLPDSLLHTIQKKAEQCESLSEAKLFLENAKHFEEKIIWERHIDRLTNDTYRKEAECITSYSALLSLYHNATPFTALHTLLAERCYQEATGTEKDAAAACEDIETARIYFRNLENTHPNQPVWLWRWYSLACTKEYEEMSKCTSLDEAMAKLATQPRDTPMWKLWNEHVIALTYWG